MASERLTDLGPEQRVIDPALRFVNVELGGHHIEVAGEYDGNTCRKKLRGCKRSSPTALAAFVGGLGASASLRRSGRIGELDPPHYASIGAPDRNRERQDEVIVFAGPGVEGQMAGRGELDPEVLQLADQRLGLGQLLLDLQLPLMQQRLQPADERQLRHAADRAVGRLDRTPGDQHADWRDAGIGEEIKHRSANTRVVDDELRVGQLSEQPPDMGDDAGIGRAQRPALKVSNLVDVAHATNLSKSSTSASSIISDEKAEVSASINSPSNSWLNSIGPSFWRIFSRNSAPMRGHSRPMILIRSTSMPSCQFS